MLCPRCAEPQLPGALRCPNCGARLRAPGLAPRRSRGAPGSVLAAWLALGVAAVLGLMLLPGLIGSGLHRAAAGVQERVAEAESSPTAAAVSVVSPLVVVASPSAQLAGTDGRQVVVTAQELNDRVTEHREDIKPLDRARIGITTGGVIVDLSAYGLSGTYHGRVVVVDGVPLVTGGKIDGVLGWFVSPDELEAALNREIESAVAQQGIQVEQVELQPGRLVFTLKS